MLWLLKAERDGYSDGLCRMCAPPAAGVHHNISRLWNESLTALRISLQFIVIAVTSVISGAFPDTYDVFYKTVNG